MLWFEYAVLFGASFFLSKVVMVHLPEVMERHGVIDHKSLPQRRPTAGGLAVAGSFLLVLGVLILVDPSAIGLPQRTAGAIWLASALVALLGFVDDYKGLNPAVKLSVQTISALILIAGGLNMGEITNPFADPLTPGVWGNLVLIVWILLLTNAVNLIDGIDGLAGGICTISAIAIFAIAHIFGEYALSLLCVVLVGALLGFLPHNLPSAKIFLGDTGSLFLGFVLAAISLIERRKGSVTVTLLVPIIVLAVPLVDTGFAFIRRAIKGENPFKGDTLHIHHRLLKLGLSPSQVDRMLFLITAYLGVAAGVMSFFEKETAVVVLLLLAVGLFMGFEFLLSMERDRSAVEEALENIEEE